MNEEQKQDEIVTLDTKEIELPTLDLTKYVGQKKPILQITEHKGQYGYYVKLATEIIESVQFGEKVVDLQASKIFGLHEDADKNIGWGVDTKLGVFLKKMGVAHYNDLQGKEVVVQTQTSKDGVDFLTFN